MVYKLLVMINRGFCFPIDVIGDQYGRILITVPFSKSQQFNCGAL